jgi:hypothetical protein
MVASSDRPDIDDVAALLAIPDLMLGPEGVQI